MKPHFKIFSAFVLLLSAACTPSDELAVRNKGLEIRWEQTAEGWKISRIADRKGRCWGVPDGAYTILFSSEKPSAEPETITNRGGDTMNFDIARFHYIAKDFNRAVSSVPMNRAGRSAALLPRKRLERGARRLLRSPKRTGPPAHDMESRPGLSGGHTHRKRVLPGAQGLLFGKHAHAGRTPRRAARLERRAGLFPRRLHPARIPPRLHVRTGTAPPAGHMQRQYGHHDDHVHDRKSGQYTGADPRQRLLPLRIQRAASARTASRGGAAFRT